jgi:tetratricopeptide (TPR) repeat protein
VGSQPTVEAQATVEGRRAESPPLHKEEEPRVPAATGDEVMALYLSYRRKDAFDLLGVPEDAGPVAIIKMYLFLAEKFLPSRCDDQEKAQEVFLAIARAYAELADPMRRDLLLKKRTKLREEAVAQAEAGPAALIDPEALWKSGRNLAAAGKLREALSSFELAAECDAQNGTYAAEAAWCRYRLGNTPAPAAMKMLKNAIRIDPQAGAAYLYAGQIQAVLGYKVEAAAYLDRAATLLPGDPRPAEAAKVLRL